MKRALAGLAALLAVAGARAAEAQPPVWVVKDGDSEMAIFGSVHLLPPGLAWRPMALDAALRGAEDLWFELPVGPAAEQETARIAAANGLLPPDRSLFSLLAPRDAERLMRVAAAYGVDKATLARMEPWLAEVALAGAAYRKAGADTRHGVEHVLNGAAAPRVRRESLETPAEQIALFDQASLADQLASLAQTVKELEEDPQGFMTLVRAWLAGDMGLIEREALAPLRKASPRLYERLVTDRNARWTKALDARLKGKGRTVVVVGVGHLVGPGSLPARLRALGYSVTGP